MVTPLKDLSRCAIHSITTKPWSLQQCIDNYAKAGLGGISVWRNLLDDLPQAARIIKSSHLNVPALVRGGGFVSPDTTGRAAAVTDNKRCIDEAAAIGAASVVLVVGTHPKVSLEDARKQVADGIAGCLDHAQQHNIKLGIEPLHPMYAASRSCINRMAEARAVVDQLNHPLVGIVVDTYHTWWDPDLQHEIQLAGQSNRIFGFHVSDWRLQTRHMLNDRGIPGEGIIHIRQIREWVEQAGFTGLIELEVFSDEHWAADQYAYLHKIARSFLTHV